MTAGSLPLGHDDRQEAVRRLERSRVRAELRVRMFGAAAEPVLVDRYELRRRLGEGAMGVVYVAFDPHLRREVALKLLTALPRGAEDALLGEARALARLAHPNVLTVHEAGVHQGVAYLISELVPGGTLRAWSNATPKPSTRAVLRLLRDVARGVAAAHQRGLVHRDLKPENILVGLDGRPRVADFGLAVTPAWPRGGSGAGASSPLPGTLAYMAPEQLRGERTDPSSDQFSFGVVAYEALFGVHPFQATTPDELLGAMERGGMAPPPKGHPALRALPAIRRALAPEPGARWPAMSALVAALDGAARGGLGRKAAIAFASVVVLGGAGAGAWIQITERQLAHRVVELTVSGRYEECASLLDEGDVGDGLLRSWIGCARAVPDPRRLERACEIWPHRTTAPPPGDCAPLVVEARALLRAGKPKACAERLLAAPPTLDGLQVLTQCTSRFRDVALFRRQCEYQKRLAPPGAADVDCQAGVQIGTP